VHLVLRRLIVVVLSLQAVAKQAIAKQTPAHFKQLQDSFTDDM
jgi:hypothetical protein